MSPQAVIGQQTSRSVIHAWRYKERPIEGYQSVFLFEVESPIGSRIDYQLVVIVLSATF